MRGFVLTCFLVGFAMRSCPAKVSGLVFVLGLVVGFVLGVAKRAPVWIVFERHSPMEDRASRDPKPREDDRPRAPPLDGKRVEARRDLFEWEKVKRVRAVSLHFWI